MALSLLSFIAITIAGFGAFHASARRAGLHTNTWINLGLGFLIAVASVGLLMKHSWLPLSVMSHAILLISCCAAALTIFLLNRGGAKCWSLDVPPFAQATWLNFFCLSLVSGYLALILISNMTREIFPWDAFTTWMFRAKVWVFNDQPVSFATLSAWLSGGAGFTLPAAHYPITVSGLAAFSAAVSGGWSDQAASIPWFFVMAAGIAIMGGLCRLQRPGNGITASVGVVLLATLPLVHWHGLLAGYADIWVMSTSGMGLAGICVWTQRRAGNILGISLLLLALGCLWKPEGWVWLALGASVTLVFSLWRRLPISARVTVVLAVVALGFVQPVDLGLLGRWGLSESELSVGMFGTFKARLYNPVPAYLEMGILQSNFLILIPLYCLALLTLLIRDLRGYLGYLMMALCLIGVHGVIFGLSEYSLYAETGTAINRLLLQNVPLLIVTITAVFQSETPPPEAAVSMDASRWWPSTLLAGGLLTVGLLLALPLTLVMSSVGTPQSVATKAQEYAPAELKPIVGDLQQTEHGYQFTGTNIPVGVAAIPIPDKGVVQPRYVVIRSWMAQPETLSFYWINSDAPGVHSTPLPFSGKTVLDMAEYRDFWQKPIQEVGFLVKPQQFEQTAIGSVMLTDSLLDAVPALLNHWMTPAPLSHRLINTATGHVLAPINLQSVLVMALALICILGLGWRLAAPNGRIIAVRGTLLAISALWLLGSIAHINQVFEVARAPSRGAHNPSNTTALDGSHLSPLIESIRQDPVLKTAPTLTVALDQASQFESQRLPFMALPTSAAAIDTSQLIESATNFSGTVVLFGKNSHQLQETAAALARVSLLRPLKSGQGYLLLSSGVE